MSNVDVDDAVTRAPGPAWTVGIVEDHALVAQFYERMFADDERFSVVLTTSEVADVFRCEEPPDLLMLDLELNGQPVSPETVALVGELGTRILVVSALADPALLRKLSAAGIHGVVSKRDSAETLMDAIESVMAGESWLSPELIAAIASSDDIDVPMLSEQEKRVIVLYASGMKIQAVARRLDISPHTVKDYLRRIRAKFLAVGRHAPTQVHLYQEAVRLGLIDENQPPG